MDTKKVDKVAKSEYFAKRMASLERPKPKEQSLPIDRLAKKWLASPRLSRCAQNTIDAYASDVENFSNFLANQDKEPTASGLTGTNLQEYLGSLEAGGSSKATVARRRASIVSLVIWAKDEGYINQNQLRNLPAPIEVPPRKIGPITEEKLAILRSALAAEKRGAVIAELIIQTGARSHELENLKVGNLHFITEPGDLKKIEVEFIHRRTGKMTVGTLDHYASDILLAYLQENGLAGKNDSPLFPSRLSIERAGEPITRQGIWEIMRPHLRKIGLQSPDKLRVAVALRRLGSEARPKVKLTTAFSRIKAS